MGALFWLTPLPPVSIGHILLSVAKTVDALGFFLFFAQFPTRVNSMCKTANALLLTVPPRMMHLESSLF